MADWSGPEKDLCQMRKCGRQSSREASPDRVPHRDAAKSWKCGTAETLVCTIMNAFARRYIFILALPVVVVTLGRVMRDEMRISNVAMLVVRRYCFVSHCVVFAPHLLKLAALLPLSTQGNVVSRVSSWQF